MRFRKRFENFHFEVTRGQKSQKRSKLRLFQKNSNYTSKWSSWAYLFKRISLEVSKVHLIGQTWAKMAKTGRISIFVKSVKCIRRNEAFDVRLYVSQKCLKVIQGFKSCILIYHLHTLEFDLKLPKICNMTSNLKFLV